MGFDQKKKVVHLQLNFFLFCQSFAVRLLRFQGFKNIFTIKQQNNRGSTTLVLLEVSIYEYFVLNSKLRPLSS